MRPFWKRRRKKPPKRDRREVWQEVAERVEGEFQEGKRKSADRVVLEFESWTPSLDTFAVGNGQHSATYTRVRAFFTGRSDLRLIVRRRNPFDAVLRWLGQGGLTSGNRRLLERFVVRGKPEARLRSLMSPGLTAAILAHPKVRLEIKRASRRERKARGESTRSVAATIGGVVKDPRQIEALFAVVTEALKALENIGEGGPLVPEDGW